MSMDTKTYTAPDGYEVIEWPGCAGLEGTGTPGFMHECTTGKEPKFCESVDVGGERFVLCYCEGHVDQMARYRFGDEYDASGRPNTQPCGNYHPLPCGLDRACEVPVEYFEAGWSSEQIWDSYLAASYQEANEADP